MVTDFIPSSSNSLHVNTVIELLVLNGLGVHQYHINILCVRQIMDEADRLLEQGCTDFTKDLETIMSILPAKRQTLLFSATLTDTLQQLKSIAMNKPYFWESKSE